MRPFFLILTLSILLVGYSKAQNFTKIVFLEYSIKSTLFGKKNKFIDTFLVIKHDTDIAKLDLEKYSLQYRSVPDTNSKPELKGFIKSYRFYTKKGDALPKILIDGELVTNLPDTSNLITYSFEYNYDNEATFIRHYYTIDVNKKLVYYRENSYSSRKQTEYKYDSTGKLIELDGGKITVTYDTSNKASMIHCNAWDDEKKKYYPDTFLKIVYLPTSTRSQ